MKLVYPLMETCAQQLVDFVKHYESTEDLEARSVSQIIFQVANGTRSNKTFPSSAKLSLHSSKCIEMWLQHRRSMLRSRPAVWIRHCWPENVWGVILGGSEILGVSIFAEMVARFDSNSVSHLNERTQGNFLTLWFREKDFCRRKWTICSTNWLWTIRNRAKKVTTATTFSKCWSRPRRSTVCDRIFN